jgi:hypothetical protein
MPSVVDIANKALDKLGASKIINIDDGTKNADLCKRAWPLIRDELLRRHPWNFATVRTSLAPSASPPDWGFSRSFDFPTDLLRLIEIRDADAIDYQVEGRAILTNESVLYIRYIARVDDPNQYDTAFIELAAARLAYELCEALTQSNTKKKSLEGDMVAAMTEATLADGMENPPAEYAEDDWLKARY